MKFKVNGDEVFASTGGRPFDKNKPLIIFVHGSGLTYDMGVANKIFCIPWLWRTSNRYAWTWFIKWGKLKIN